MGDFQRKLKEGEVLRYKSSLLSKKWKECWAVLFSDSEFVWYDKKGDSKPAGSIFLKDVVPYTCVGPMCDRMPVRRPELPPRYSLYHLVGIGMDSQASKVHWFLFASDSDLESWFTEIMKTLPKPNPPPADAEKLLPSGPNAPPPAYNPPPVYPSGPPQATNMYPNQPAYYPATNPPQPPSYPSAAPSYAGAAPGGGAGTTVIINERNGGGYGRFGGYSGGYGGGYSSGPGLGTGMLMGSLLGFGLGSMWGGGLHSGFGFGSHCYPSHLGMGGGFGGGYLQDNDTYITNNYYGGGPESRGAIEEHDTESTTVVGTADSTNQDSAQDYYDGYDVGGGSYDDYGGYDIGGYDDSGGYDIGGSDDFGGDFGGGDW